MSEKRTLARPYADAAFELAQAQNRLGAWSEMLKLVAAVGADPGVIALAANPRVSDEQIVQLFKDVCGDALDAGGINMLMLLLENGKLSLLPEIHELFELRKADAENSVEAEVLSAFKLSAAERSAIAAALKKRLGREINLVAREDKSLLGGVIIRAGDLVIDGSVRGRLRDLSSQLNQ